MIDLKTVEKLAQLSRLKLSDEEKEKFRSEINSILGYVEHIRGVETLISKGPLKEPVRNVIREDINPHESGVYTQDIVNEFPRREGNYLKVKNILDK